MTFHFNIIKKNFFITSDKSVTQHRIEILKSDPPNTNVIKPFAPITMNNFDGFDLFDAFFSSSNPVFS